MEQEKNHGKKNKYLVICRVGDQSLHREWILPSEFKNFDIFIDYYGSDENRYIEDSDFYTENKGLKWPGLFSLIERYKDIVFDYEAVWFPDDDIKTNAKTINEMFKLFSYYDLKLAQPALTKDSYFTHGITIVNNHFKLRFTDFVEVMVPIFSRDALLEVYQTFNESQSGWGLDNIWPKKLKATEKQIAILDQTPVTHTRPVGGGELYAKLNISPHLEVRKLLRKYDVLLKKFIVYDGILADSQKVYSDSYALDLGIHILRGAPNELISVTKFENEYLYPNITRHMKNSYSMQKVTEIIMSMDKDNISNYIDIVLDFHDSMIINAIEQYSNNIIGHMNLIGEALIQDEQLERGLMYLNNAFVLDETNSITLYNLANACYVLGKYENALHFLNLIRDKDSRDLELLYRVMSKSNKVSF
ncbi:DUF707 domain-containing protein [Neobacillus muris]|uniref:DUF707 domain-containing protein n=1 Tax=Neobacillus muris TaxID=2941334 RepID=UPI002041747E|nr:DUF707 domain-containing protein [Neobacillus muris]